MELENFNAKQYLANYADLQKAFGTDEEKAKQHYKDYGIKEGRSDIDAKQYLANYTDLQKAFGDNTSAALQHYSQYGKDEGRTDEITDEFKERVAAQAETRRGLQDQLQNLGPDATEDQRQSLVQQIVEATPGDRAAKAKRMAEAAQRRSDFVAGKEGATFDAQQYLSNYKDLQEAFGDDVEAAKQHYKDYGIKEGRTDTKDKINVEEYLSQYKDLQDAFGTDRQAGLQHYIQHGIKEGRSQQGGTKAPDEAVESFDAETYLKNYVDLQDTFGDDQEAARQHFLQYGAQEGRTDLPIKQANETGGSDEKSPVNGGTDGTTPIGDGKSPVNGGTDGKTPVNGEAGGTTPVNGGTDKDSGPSTQAEIDATQSKQIEDLMKSDVDATQSKQIEDLYKMYNESKKTGTTTKTEKDPYKTFTPGENPYRNDGYNQALLRAQEKLLDKAERKAESNRMKREERKSIREINKREQNRRDNDPGEVNIGDVQGSRGSVRNVAFYGEPTN